MAPRKVQIMTPQEAKERWPFETIEPREVQLEAIAAGYGKTGFAYFMRQRLGKSWTAFAEYTLLRQEGKVDWCFIICPNSIKEQWREAIEEANEFIPICVYSAGAKIKTRFFFNKNKRGGVFIINYESLQAFNDEFVFMLEGEPIFNASRTYLVADESTKIKNPKQR
jgi:SNF2 family DNA or RNA helicase